MTDYTCKDHAAQAQGDDTQTRKERGWFYKLKSTVLYGSMGVIFEKGYSVEVRDLFGIIRPLPIDTVVEEFCDGWKKGGELEKKYGRAKPGIRLWRTIIFRCHARSEIKSALLCAISVCLGLAVLVCLKMLTEVFVSVPDKIAKGKNVDWNLIWVQGTLNVVIPALALLSNIAFTYHRHRLGLAKQLALLLVLYRRTLSKRGRYNLITVGHVSLVISRYTDTMMVFHGRYMDILSAVLTSSGVLVIGYYLLGWQFVSAIPLNLLFACVVIPSIIPFLKITSVKMHKFGSKITKAACRAIYGIVHVKLWGWEKVCSEEIKHYRAKEDRYMRKKFLIENYVVHWSGLYPIGVFALLIFLWITTDPDKFTPATAIVAAALNARFLNSVQLFIACYYCSASNAHVAIVEVEKFLRLVFDTDVDSNATDVANSESDALPCEDDSIPPCKRSQREGLKKGSISLHGSFGTHSLSSEISLETERPSDSFVLENVDVKINDGELVCILGPTGSGKTTLIMAMLNEAQFPPPSLNKELPHYKQPIGGRVAYVGQVPWLQSLTIRDNILFGSNFDIERYSEVLKVCRLEEDLNTLTLGDQTLIGSQGVKLSGGQKARVCLARSIYKDADVYIFDDPLSSLDPKTGSTIYTNVLRGLLREKTRILVTHHTSYLQADEKMIILGEKNGVIKVEGTWADVKKMAGVASIPLPGGCLEDEDKGENVLPVDKNDPTTRLVFTAPHDTSLTPSINVEKDTSVSLTTRSLGYFFHQALGWKGTALLSFLVALYCMLSVGQLVYLSVWANSPTYVSEAILWFGGFAVLTIISIAAVASAYLLYIFVVLGANTTLHGKMTDAVFRSPMSFFHGSNYGDILNHFSCDMHTLDQHVSQRVIDLFIIFWFQFASFILVTVTNIASVIFTCLFIFCSYFFMSSVWPATSTLSVMTTTLFSNVQHIMSESVEGIVTIRAFNSVDCIVSIADQAIRDYSTALSAVYEIEHRVLLFLSIFRVIFVAILIYGGFLVLKLSVDFVEPAAMSAALVVFVNSAYSIIAGLGQFITLMPALSCLDRVMKYSNLEPEPDWYSQKGKAPPDNWPSKGRISVSNLWVRYGTHLPYILRGMSFEIHPGSCVGIVGRTGCGKSTLVMTLFRLLEYDSSRGYIMIDGIKTCDVGLHELRSKMSIVSQEPFMFTGTIRHNMDPSETISDVKIWEAVKLLQLEECIRSLDIEIDIECTDTFSTGQKQLICFARSLLKNKKIYVMDEPTAYIDAEKDAAVIARVKELTKNSTVIMVAHRLRTIIGADKIIVMGEGGVSEYGSPRELLKKDGIFSEIVNDSGAQEQLMREAEICEASRVLANVNGE